MRIWQLSYIVTLWMLLDTTTIQAQYLGFNDGGQNDPSTGNDTGFDDVQQISPGFGNNTFKDEEEISPGFGKNTQRATEVSFEKDSLSVTVGETIQLVATIVPNTAIDTPLRWQSSDESIATVDENGVVTIKEVGEVTIYVSVTYNGEIKDSCVISVASLTYKKGDVNHDGNITMADANAVVNYYLATNKPEDFDVESADVNGDGDITMADANMIVNMFLGGK